MRIASLVPSLTETLTRWLELAETRLAGTDITCLVSPGNDDQPFIDELLGSSARVINPDSRVVELPGGFELVSLGFANRTPWNSPRELDEPELAARIEALAGWRLADPELRLPLSVAVRIVQEEQI